ncbi:hypothetical protein GGTG_06685 [Gaeumannomyces tritici R3-111a-1]|uniref:BTB domain-containing protein n=1 Tax=Gaeumannomyces tritici (strain R3-111a-1) TaxID=644352 RepID=J3NZI7_GAET3|nr:hypothetical protein GGTG_06685 [Gaeumannomyces tritici R3-111a-1]EJT76770.1 hypothetical protein GGTG_06685 [Gaeumannomyces tritici R3-111a-1]
MIRIGLAANKPKSKRSPARSPYPPNNHQMGSVGNMASPTTRTRSTSSVKTLRSGRPTKGSRSKSTPLLMGDVTEEEGQAASPIIFDQDGDLHLAVGTAKVNPMRFVVCSRTLARASPVFRTMLFGAFSESSRPGGAQRTSSQASATSGSDSAALGSLSSSSGSCLALSSSSLSLPSASVPDASSTEFPITPPSSTTSPTSLALPKEQDEWTAELPEDDPRAFRILMGIIHSSFAEHVPETIELVELFHVAILADKYDMTHLLRPWAEGWCSSQRGRRHPYRLWIAWVLGDDTMFESEARRLALGCPVNKYGQLLIRCTNGNLMPLETFDYLRLPDILEPIAATRLEAADQILQKITAVHRKLATANGRHCREPTASTKQECRLDCENALLGSMVKALDACGLWPIPAAPQLTVSLDALVAKVASAAQMIRPLSSSSGSSMSPMGGGVRHAGCNPGTEVEDFARRVLAGVPTPVQHAHLTHMELQAVKSGLSVGTDKAEL